jgi:hypothetical protein
MGATGADGLSEREPADGTRATLLGKGTSASPAGSSAIMLHQPNEREEGAMTAPGITSITLT